MTNKPPSVDHGCHYIALKINPSCSLFYKEGIHERIHSGQGGLNEAKAFSHETTAGHHEMPVQRPDCKTDVKMAWGRGSVVSILGS